jgi:hypothetical protein
LDDFKRIKLRRELDCRELESLPELHPEASAAVWGASSWKTTTARLTCNEGASEEAGREEGASGEGRYEEALQRKPLTRCACCSGLWGKQTIVGRVAEFRPAADFRRPIVRPA